LPRGFPSRITTSLGGSLNTERLPDCSLLLFRVRVGAINPNVAKVGGLQSQEEHPCKIKIDASSSKAKASRVKPE